MPLRTLSGIQITLSVYKEKYDSEHEWGIGWDNENNKVQLSQHRKGN